jgi:hypothetical protein
MSKSKVKCIYLECVQSLGLDKELLEIEMCIGEELTCFQLSQPVPGGRGSALCAGTHI